MVFLSLRRVRTAVTYEQSYHRQFPARELVGPLGDQPAFFLLSARQQHVNPIVFATSPGSQGFNRFEATVPWPNPATPA